jgi:hypothetical protein
MQKRQYSVCEVRFPEGEINSGLQYLSEIIVALKGKSKTKALHHKVMWGWWT